MIKHLIFFSFTLFIALSIYACNTNEVDSNKILIESYIGKTIKNVWKENNYTYHLYFTDGSYLKLSTYKYHLKLNPNREIVK